MSDKITEPGIYDLTMAEYHDEPCAEPSISSSGLRTLLNDCPALYWWSSPMNPKRPIVEKKHFSLGKAAHDFDLVGLEQFLVTNYVLAEDCNLRTKAGKAERDEALADGLNVISYGDFETVKAMRAALHAHEFAAASFTDGLAERSLVWRDAETGVMLRCRPDWLPTALRHIPDYKTAISAKPRDFARRVWEFGYHMQAALYLDGIAAVTGERPLSFYFVVQEKTAPYLVTCITLDATAIEWGRIQNRAAIHRFATCLETDEWPGYARDVVETPLPGYAENELTIAHEHGRFDVLDPEKAA